MAKKLAFGGKGLNIVTGSRVASKDGHKEGTVQDIRFTPRLIPKTFLVQWDGQRTPTWIPAKSVRPS